MNEEKQENYKRTITNLTNTNEFYKSLVRIREEEIKLLMKEREELYKRIIQLI